jgi:hypothetical protein
MQENTLKIIVTVNLGTKINHFILLMGEIQLSDVDKVKSINFNENTLVNICKKEECKDWGRFWNSPVLEEDNKVNTFHFRNRFNYYYSEDLEVLNKLCELPESLMKIININELLLFKNITIIESLLEDNINSSIWKNYSNYIFDNPKKKNDWRLSKSNFLNKLFYSKHVRFCYLILNEEQKESEYYILNQSFRTDQSLLLIEYEEPENSLLNRFRFKIIKQTQQHSWHFFNENEIEILHEFEVYILDNYSNYEREYEELFLIHSKDVETLADVVNKIDEKYCYRWINEEIFINLNKNEKFKQSNNSLWTEKRIFGVVVREFEFSQKCSDFGSDNSHIVAFGDSEYQCLSKPPQDVWWTPRGVDGNHKTYEDYYHMATNLYDYFYESKKYLLVNFDEVPYIDRVNRYFQGYIADSITQLSMIKTIRIPKFLLEDSFVLTRDLYIKSK